VEGKEGVGFDPWRLVDNFREQEMASGRRRRRKEAAVLLKSNLKH
jgi:hypothetical protein